MDYIKREIQPYLDKFVVIFIDDILVYSRTPKDHVEPIGIVLSIMKKINYLKLLLSLNVGGEIPWACGISRESGSKPLEGRSKLELREARECIRSEEFLGIIWLLSEVYHGILLISPTFD